MILSYKVNSTKYYNVKEVLKAEFGISDRLLIKLKNSQNIYLNNKKVFVTEVLNIGDLVECKIDFEENSEGILPTKMDLDILFEDEYLLILNKPANMPIHPSQNHFEDSLSNGVQYYFNKINLNKKIRPVNRLDKDTSGIVIFAKNEYIQESLVKQMKSKEFKKEYIALLVGSLSQKYGTINAPIARKDGSIMEREISENGEFAISHYEVIKEFENYAEVHYTLETGRTHQLRVHSKYIGHPILGDTLYGFNSNLINRQALHSHKTTFIHPITKKKTEIIAPIPADINSLIC